MTSTTDTLVEKNDFSCMTLVVASKIISNNSEIQKNCSQEYAAIWKRYEVFFDDKT